MILRRVLESSESFDRADGPAGSAQRALRGLLAGTRVDRLLRGSWLGHPVHPLLITLPIGAWTCAAVLDRVSGEHDAARRLVGLGLLATGPTAVTGAADWSTLDVRGRRVGALHAAANTAAAACFIVSYRHRARGAHAAGAAWTLAGLLPIAVGGALGGHLSYALGAGVGRWQGPDTPGDPDTPRRP